MDVANLEILYRWRGEVKDAGASAFTETSVNHFAWSVVNRGVKEAVAAFVAEQHQITHDWMFSPTMQMCLLVRAVWNLFP